MFRGTNCQVMAGVHQRNWEDVTRRLCLSTKVLKAQLHVSTLQSRHAIIPGKPGVSGERNENRGKKSRRPGGERRLNSFNNGGG